MFKKMLLAMPLVLVLALVAFIGTSQGKVGLSDAQLSSIYGGGTDCKHYDYKGCSAASGICDEEAIDPEDCVSPEMTTCKQQRKRCQRPGWNGCTNNTVDCVGTYDYRECNWLLPEEACYVGFWIQRNCKDVYPYKKWWCYES